MFCTIYHNSNEPWENLPLEIAFAPLSCVRFNTCSFKVCVLGSAVYVFSNTPQLCQLISPISTTGNDNLCRVNLRTTSRALQFLMGTSLNVATSPSCHSCRLKTPYLLQEFSLSILLIMRAKGHKIAFSIKHLPILNQNSYLYAAIR